MLFCRLSRIELDPENPRKLAIDLADVDRALDQMIHFINVNKRN